MYEKTVLPNGVRVVSAYAPQSYSTAISLYFGVGSRHESMELSGVSHFLEHMLFKGTQCRPSARAISEAVEGVGGMLNAGTGREYTTYWTKLPAEYTERGLSLLADMAQHSLIEPEEVERERRVILEEIKGREDSPGRLAVGILDGLLWSEQPLGREVAGSEDTVSGITREHMAAHAARYYTAGNLVVSCAGPVEHERVVAWASDVLRDIATGSGEQGVVPGHTGGARRVELAGKPVKQANFSLGFPAISYEDPRRYALNILDSVLGGGMSSRLFLEVRERRGLAYSVGSYAQQYRDDGAFIVHAAVAPEQLGASLGAVFEQLDRIATEPLDADDLARVKRYIKGRTVMGLEASRGLATWGGRQELLRDRIRDLDEVLAEVDAVTAEDVLALAGAIFVPGVSCLAVVGPFEDAGEIEPLIDGR